MYNVVLLYIMKTEVLFIPAVNKEITFTIGENAQDNFDIIDDAHPNDLWFHIHNESSCHVIASMPRDEKLNKKQIHKIITQGSCICKKNSKYKSNKDVEIVYSYICNVVKTHIIGQVNVSNQKFITI